MTGDRAAQFALYAVMLILPLSALVARRSAVKPMLKMALAWVGIFAVGLLIASQRDRLSGVIAMFDDQQVSGTETRIRMADDGHFWANVEINGVGRRMLIDSGATTTALSTQTAKAAGLDLSESPFPVILSTANGQVTARSATAKRVAVGYRHDRPGNRDVAGLRRDGHPRHEFSVAAGFMAGRRKDADPLATTIPYLT